MSPEHIPQSVRLVRCREVGDLIPYRCGYVGVNEIACEGTPCPIYEYRLVRDDEATVERMARALAQCEGLGDWPVNYEEQARAALTAAQGGESA